MDPSSIHHPTQLDQTILIQEVLSENQKTERPEKTGKMSGSSGNEYRIDINVQERSDSEIGLTTRSVKHKGTETLSSNNQEGSLEMSDLRDRPNLRHIEGNGQSTERSTLPLRTNTTATSQLGMKPPQDTSLERTEVSRSPVIKRNGYPDSDDDEDDDITQQGTSMNNTILDGEPIQQQHVEEDASVEVNLTQAPRQTEVEQPAIELFEAGSTHRIEDRSDIKHNRETPPQTILRDAIALAKQTPGFEGAKVKVRSSMDDDLKNNTSFKVEPFINAKGVLLYKVSVDYTVTLTGEDEKTMELTLNREFYTNAANDREALIAIYNVSRSVQKLAVADNPDGETLKAQVFQVSYARDSQKNITGVKSVMANNVDITKGFKSSFKHDVNETGQAKLRKVERETGDTQNFKEALLLKAKIESSQSIPIMERLKRRKINVNEHVGSLKMKSNYHDADYKAIKEEVIKDDLFKWIRKGKKDEYSQLMTQINSGEVNPKDLGLSENMEEYLIAKQNYLQARDLQTTLDKLKELKTSLDTNRALTDEQKELVEELKTKHGLQEITGTAVHQIMASVIHKKNQFLQKVGANYAHDGQLKLDQLLQEYQETRRIALNDHQKLFSNMERMNSIQSDLQSKLDELNEMHEGIKQSDIERNVAEHQLALVEEAQGKIKKQLAENAEMQKKLTNAQIRLGKVFKDETPIPQETPRADVNVGMAPE